MSNLPLIDENEFKVRFVQNEFPTFFKTTPRPFSSSSFIFSVYVEEDKNHPENNSKVFSLISTRHIDFILGQERELEDFIDSINGEKLLCFKTRKQHVSRDGESYDLFPIDEKTLSWEENSNFEMTDEIFDRATQAINDQVEKCKETFERMKNGT